MSQSGNNQTLIEDCEKRESKLSNWERGFIDSVRAQLEKDRPLTERQTEILEKIWDRIT
jgi:hypothetical protein